MAAPPEPAGTPADSRAGPAVARHLYATALFLAGLALYVPTVAPGVQGGDSGEFQLVGYVLGIAHPPGYPFYTVVSKLWTLAFGFLDPAYAVNLLSAAFAAGALAASGLALVQLAPSFRLGGDAGAAQGPAGIPNRRREDRGVGDASAARGLVGVPDRRLADFEVGARAGVARGPIGVPNRRLASLWIGGAGGLVAALWLAAVPTWWSQATVASVRPPTGFFVAAILAALASFEATRSRRALFVAAALYGASLTHHISLYTLAPALVLFVLLRDSTILRQPRTLGTIALCGGLPLLLYLYLPIRSAIGAPFDASHPTTLPAFLDLITARGFAGDMLAFDPLAPARLELGRQILLTSFGTTGVVLAGLGLLATLVWRPRWAILTLGIAAINLAISLSYRAPVIADYLIPTYIVAALWIGGLVPAVAGWLAALIRLTGSRGTARVVPTVAALIDGPESGPRHAAQATAAVGGVSIPSMVPRRDRSLNGTAKIAVAAGAAAIAAALAVTPIDYLVRAAPAFDRHADRADEELLRRAFADSEPSATILADWYNATILWYGQMVRGERRDLMVDYVAPEGATVPWLARAERALARGPVYVTSLDRALGERLHLQPRGALYAVRRDPDRVVPSELAPAAIRFGPAIELVGTRVEAVATSAADVQVELAWRAVRPIAQDYREFIHLADATGYVWGQRDGTPGEGLYPTTRWRPGEIVVERYTFSAAPSAGQRELAIKVGLYETLAGGGWRRLEATDAGGQPLGDAPTIGRVTVQPIEPPPDRRVDPPTVRNPLGRIAGRVDRVIRGDGPSSGVPSWAAISGRAWTPLGRRILLTGWAIDRAEARPGETLRVALDFLPLDRLPEDGAIFVHLVDSGGQLRAQRDSVPVDGGLPTLRWAPDRPVRDIRELRLPTDLAPGQYQVRAGIYVMSTGAHLPVLDDGLAKAGQADHIVLATVAVRP